MRTVAYSCPFVPAEWIAAHALEPVWMFPSASAPGEAVRRREGLCPYARASVNALTRPPVPDAAVFTTVCDQMRRAVELCGAALDLPVFLMNVPSTWRTPAASNRAPVPNRKASRHSTRSNVSARSSHDDSN